MSSPFAAFCNLVDGCRSAFSSEVCRQRPERDTLAGRGTHLTCGWTAAECQAGEVRLPWKVAPVSCAVIGRRYVAGCWPAPPRPPKLRSVRGLWPGIASSPVHETAPRCDPQCRHESVVLF